MKGRVMYVALLMTALVSVPKSSRLQNIGSDAVVLVKMTVLS